MKRVLLPFALLFMTTIIAFSQNENQIENQTENQIEEVHPTTYLSLGSGINSYNGMVGFGAEVQLIDNITVFGGLGIGTWGSKATIGGRFYRGYPKGVNYSVSYSTASGMRDVMMDIATTRNPTGTEKVEMTLDRANSLNLALGYYFRLSRRVRFNLDLGYAISLGEVTYKVTSPCVTLTDDSDLILRMMAPGGLLLGLGFSFGF